MAKIKNNTIKLFKLISSGIFYTIPLFATFLIFSNSLETITRKDLFPTNAINSYINTTEYFSGFNTNNPTPNLTGNPIGDYGKPLILSIPRINRRLEIVQAIIDKNKLLNRPNNAHYMTLEEDGKIRVVAMYLTKSWRTIPNPEEIQPGINLYVDTNSGWRYVFEVEEILKVNINTYFAPNEPNTQMLLIIKDQETDEMIIIRAVYRTVLSI